MEKLDKGLKMLFDCGKRRGFSTFDQVDDCVHGDTSHPGQITHPLESLDEPGIELVNKDEAESRLPASGDFEDELVEDDEDGPPPADRDDPSHRIDDPLRTYLTEMGRIPL